MQVNHTLTSLDLSRNDIGTEGAVFIGDVLKVKAIGAGVNE